MAVHKDDIKNKLKQGVSRIADAVKVTLGPMGRNVILDKNIGDPIITKDGVSVAKAVELPDKIENIAARLMKRVATNVLNEAGDGTTTATVLAEAIFNNGLQVIKRAGISPIELKRQIDKAVESIVSFLKENSIKITKENFDYLREVAAISANNDDELADLIFSAVKKAGSKGLVKVDQANDVVSSIVAVKGLEYDRGYAAPYFVTDQVNQIVDYKNCYVAVYDKPLDDIDEAYELLNVGAFPLMVVANDFSNDVLSMFIVNKTKGIADIVAIKSPGFGNYRSENLKDIAMLSNSMVIDGLTESNYIKTQFMSKVPQVIVSATKTTFMGTYQDQAVLDSYISELELKREHANADYDKEVLSNRIAKFTDGIVTINVGARTELELIEKKDRVEDALLATMAALEEGVIIGGGNALFKIAKKFEESTVLGERVLKDAIKAPYLTILKNADLKQTSCDVVNFSHGLNVKTGEYGDLYEMGVIDPVKVTRVALQQAASIAGMLLTTERIVDAYVDPEEQLYA